MIDMDLSKINNLFHMVLYVRNNEETSYLKIIHFYEQEAGLPSELEANAKSKGFTIWDALWKGWRFLSVLDESFPEITIDLVSFCSPTFDLLLTVSIILDPGRRQFRTCERRCPLSSSSHTTVIDVYDLSRRTVPLFRRWIWDANYCTLVTSLQWACGLWSTATVCLFYLSGCVANECWFQTVCRWKYTKCCLFPTEHDRS